MFRIDKLSCYDKFKCIMGKCPASCCENWNISVDQATYERYRNCTNEYVRNHISKEEPHVILKKDNKCAFFQEDGLCFLHKEYGEDFLCETCKSYPRFVSTYEDIYTLSLAPSCPAVLDILKKETLEISTKIYYESEEEVNSSLSLSNELNQKLQLREQLVGEILNNENCLEQKICSIEEKLGNGKRVEKNDVNGDNLSLVNDYIIEHCLIDDKMVKQAEKIKNSNIVIEEIDVEKMSEQLIEEYRNWPKYFENILLCWLFECILRIEKVSRKEVDILMARARLLMATIQYWILLVYCVDQTISEEECDAAIYSIMRVLDHSENALENYYNIWNDLGRTPLKVLW